jgi:uncharacterized alkaline shock family protein YloU
LGPGGAVRYHAMSNEPTPGRALVTRRAIADIVRNVTLGSYGVAGFAGAGPSGLRISVRDGLRISLRLRVAHGLPIAEVARQLDAAIRHAIRQALSRDVDRLTIEVDQLEAHPGGKPPARRVRRATSSALADSGTDVA